MNFEMFFAKVVVLIGLLLATGIVFYFKGYHDGVKETADEFFKKDKSEDTE